MASSNRHWPSMFKSKPTHHHQWQHDINSSLLSTGCLRSTPYTTGGSSGEERTPEPKPRWNPRPEQIRILEAIFNSGMVNPPREEIRKIRAQLQEYGQVGDANVFYWFQNRKSRSKHKQRQQLTQKPSPPSTNNSNNSSSSSNKSSPSPNNSAEKNKILSVGSTTTVIDLLNSPTASVNKPFFVPTSTQTHNEFLTEPFYFAVPQHNTSISTTTSAPQGFCFADHHNQTSNVIAGECPSFLLNDLMLMSSNTNTTTNGASKKVEDDDKIMKLHDQQIMNYASNTHTVAPPHQSLAVSTLPSTNYIFQGVPESGPTKSTVFINDVCFEVGLGPFNIKEAFGDDAVLIQSNGQHVLTNEWGVTLQPLQHGAFYYLMRAFAPPHHIDDRTTIDLM